MTDQQIFEALVEHIKTKIPGFEIGYKNESSMSKLLGILAYPFNQEYMKSYTTTRYPKVFFPSREYVENNYRLAWKILSHEYVHLWDRYQEGVVFNLKYVSPQLWALLAVVTAVLVPLVGPWGFLGLLPLLLALPWPSPGRRDAELRGYTMSMAVDFWRKGSVSESTVTWIVKQFTGSSYYFMWPFYEGMRKRLDASVEALKDHSIFQWPNPEPYKEVKDLITGSEAP